MWEDVSRRRGGGGIRRGRLGCTCFYWREKEREREVYMINEWGKKYWLPS